MVEWAIDDDSGALDVDPAGNARGTRVAGLLDRGQASRQTTTSVRRRRQLPRIFYFNAETALERKPSHPQTSSSFVGRVALKLQRRLVDQVVLRCG